MNSISIKIKRQNLHSALCSYQTNLTGWQSHQGIQSMDTFKQLKVNLNRYQQKYNQQKTFKTINTNQKLHHNKEQIQNKQNQIKLPSVLHSTPLKIYRYNKEPFAVKSRDFLQDAINYNEESKAKIFRISRLIKAKRNNLLQQSKQKQKQDYSYIMRRKISNLSSNSLIQYDFSDSRLISRKDIFKRDKLSSRYLHINNL